MLDWYRKLIQLRQTTPSLNNGEPGNSNVTFSDEQRWLRVIRGRIVIVCDLSQNAALLPLDREAKLVLSSQPNVIAEIGGITLPPDSIAVLQIRER